MLRAAARSTPSKMTELGSPPSLPRTNSAPLRSAHVCSCSAAAARNVSPAAISTLRPSSRCSAATLPMVVVLPTPLTPTNSHTLGEPVGAGYELQRSLGGPAGEPSSRPAAPPATRRDRRSPWPCTRAFSPASSSSVTRTPTSARSSASSRSFHVSSVMPVRLRMPRNAPVSALRALPIRLRKVGRSPIVSASIASGCSTSTSTSASASVVGRDRHIDRRLDDRRCGRGDRRGAGARRRVAWWQAVERWRCAGG